MATAWVFRKYATDESLFDVESEAREAGRRLRPVSAFVVLGQPVHRLLVHKVVFSVDGRAEFAVLVSKPQQLLLKLDGLSSPGWMLVYKDLPPNDDCFEERLAQSKAAKI